MARTARVCAAVMAILPWLAVGCQYTPSETPATEMVEVSLEHVAERSAAAERIGNIALRDQAFTAIAQDAVAGGHVDAGIEALGRVKGLEARDEAAATCARLALRLARLADARKLAAKIHTVPLRDAVFSEIAIGDR